MARHYRRGSRRLLISMLVGFGLCQGAGYGGAVDGAPESHLLPAAEKRLEEGKPGAAVALYEDAFAAAADFTERLSLIGPLARAAIVSQEEDALFAALNATGEVGGEPWEAPIFRAAVFQFLQDLQASLERVSLLSGLDQPEHLAGLLRDQQRMWAEEAGNAAEVLRLSREAFAESPTAGNHIPYVRALLETGTEEELLAHLGERSQELVSEAGRWRSLLPELQKSDAFETVAGLLEAAWLEEGEDPEVLFALAELHLFQERLEEAVSLFWNIFELREEARPADGMAYFQRLNHFFHNRYAVKNRLGEATQKYGTAACREFSFLGLRENPLVSDVASARDVSLLYLRELLPPGGASGDFLQRVRTGLDREFRPPGQRILAFAGAGAPAWMVEEIVAFVQSPVEDSAAAEFSLLAMNRFLLSTNKFPELRLQMRDLARAMEGKFREGRPRAVRQRNHEMRERVLSRLGFAERAGGGGDERSREQLYERMAKAVEEGDPAKAERMYRDLSGGRQESGLDNALLFLARAWQDKNEPERAAGLVAEFLASLDRSGTGQPVPAPLEWPESAGFPPPNPFLGEPELEALQAAFGIIQDSPAWERLAEILAVRDEATPRADRPAARVIRSTLHWWAGERDEAIAAARSGAESVEDPEVQLLLAYLLGMDGRFDEGRGILEEIAATANSAGDRARRLLFAFAVAARDRDQAQVRALAVEDLPLSGSEKLRIAFALSSLELDQPAANWLEEVPPAELSSREIDLYRLVRLKLLVHSRDQEGAMAQARLILLGDMPSSFQSLLTTVRLEALGVLQSAGEIDGYQAQIRGLLGLAPKSPALHFLLGESADFLWKKGETKQEPGGLEAKEEAVHNYRRAVALRPEFGDMQLELCEWLAEHGLWEEAVAEYRKLLDRDAPSALLDVRRLFEAFRQAEELPVLVDFLDEWQVPEATSINAFYGLQPTAHIFHPLGEILLEEGEREVAVRAWRKGLAINPIEFTEEIRIALGEAYEEEGEASQVLELLRNYVDQPNPDPDFYAVQPFASVVPRWVAALTAASDPSVSPVERLITMASAALGEDEVRAAAEEWSRHASDRLSVAAFRVYLAARAESPGWRGELETLEESFGVEEGPLKGGWEAVERLFQEKFPLS